MTSLASLILFLLAAAALQAQETDRVHVDPATGEVTLAARNTRLRWEQLSPADRAALISFLQSL